MTPNFQDMAGMSDMRNGLVETGTAIVQAPGQRPALLPDGASPNTSRSIRRGGAAVRSGRAGAAA